MNKEARNVSIIIITITIAFITLLILNFSTFKVIETTEVLINDCQHYGLFSSTVVNNDIEYQGTTEITSFLLVYSRNLSDKREGQFLILTIKENVFGKKTYHATLK